MPTSLDEVRALLDAERERFAGARRVLSFEQYLELFLADPRRYGRDAARYLRDLFDHYGTEPVLKPYGRFTRWRLFDLPWEDEAGQRDALVGHELLQSEVYRAVANFARQGAVNRLILLHGPNGSAKSTLAGCVLRAMEDYSQQDAGALYRFHWVFPRARSTEAGRIGFGFGAREDDGPRPGESYAHLDEGSIDARLLCEVRDHPMLLLPSSVRDPIVDRAFAGGREPAPTLLTRGGLCHKCQMVFQSLLSAYRGDLSKVLAHVQVERWYVSRRYRQGAVTLGPQMAVDARERQVTAPRSLSALPPTLQNTTLFEPFGELVDAAGGALEYSDLLKRPLDAWKYLLLMIESGEVALTTSNLAPNVVLIGSSNEAHLDAFREHPEYPSFRGRLELARAPYLLDWKDEARIYDRQALPGIDRHVAPHAVEMAAIFAVLSRLRKPAADRLPRALASLVGDLTPMEKAELLASGAVPQRYNDEQAKDLKAGIESLWREGESQTMYEGRVGASPREIRGVILDAAHAPEFKCLSPFAVLDRLGELSGRKSEFEWLRMETVAGGYHDARGFLKSLRVRLLDEVEGEVRDATGLVDEARYVESFERYVTHVSAWLKGEKIHNRVSRKDEPADEAMLREVEKLIGMSGSADEVRRNVMSRLAAWALDHPGEKVPYGQIFPQQLAALRDHFFKERRKQIVQATQDLLRLLSDAASLEADARARAEGTFERLKTVGYCEHCARDAADALLRERYAESPAR